MNATQEDNHSKSELKRLCTLNPLGMAERMHQLERSGQADYFYGVEKEMKLFIVLLIAIFITGCTSQTEFGQCVGVGDDKDPNLVYKLSANNLVWAILGFELIAPPIVVAVDETFCPIGKKK